MSVIGRLWRRAPAWRLLLFTAVTTTALCAMFPPRLPTFSLARPQPTGPRYRPPNATAPPDYTAISTPPITGTRHGFIPFGGRQVPLPQGNWSEIVLLQAVGPVSRQGVVLARLQSGRMTGMIVALGTPPTDRDAPIPSAACVDPTGMPVHMLEQPQADDPLAQECWSLRRLTTSELVTSRNPLEFRAFSRLGKLDVAVPAHLLAVRYYRHDGGATLAVTTLLPDPNESAGLVRRTDAWARGWVGVLHRGFDDALIARDVSGAPARDPDAKSD